MQTSLDASDSSTYTIHSDSSDNIGLQLARYRQRFIELEKNLASHGLGGQQPSDPKNREHSSTRRRARRRRGSNHSSRKVAAASRADPFDVETPARSSFGVYNVSTAAASISPPRCASSPRCPPLSDSADATTFSLRERIKTLELQNTVLRWIRRAPKERLLLSLAANACSIAARDRLLCKYWLRLRLWTRRNAYTAGLVEANPQSEERPSKVALLNPTRVEKLELVCEEQRHVIEALMAQLNDTTLRAAMLEESLKKLHVDADNVHVDRDAQFWINQTEAVSILSKEEATSRTALISTFFDQYDALAVSFFTIAAQIDN